MVDPVSRHLEFDFIGNLRDIGGFSTRDGRTVARGRVFRSSEPRQESVEHLELLRQVTGLATVIDLRAEGEIKKGPVGLYAAAGIRYFNVPFIGGSIDQKPDLDLVTRFTCMGQFYLYLLRDPEYRGNVIQALEIIAEPQNHAVLFHCAVGKDRTGILAAFILSILGVPDKDIIDDYAVTSLSMPAFMERLKDDPASAAIMERLPAYMWEATPESMEVFLSELQREHGTLRGCLESCGVDGDLFGKLEAALLE